VIDQASKCRAVVGLSLGLASFMACGGGNEDSSSSNAANMTSAEIRNLSARVTERRVTQEGRVCTVDFGIPLVDVGGNASVNSAIAQALPKPSAASLCAELVALVAEAGPEVGPGFIEGRFTVTTNTHAILSLTLSRSSFVRDYDAHPNDVVKGQTFDLRSGREITLAGVLNQAGVASAIASCINTFAPILDEAPARAQQSRRYCEDGVQTNTFGFTVEREGLRIQLDVPHVIQGAMRDALVRWSVLDDGLQPSLVADYRKTLTR
jgi:hypothetical protein